MNVNGRFGTRCWVTLYICTIAVSAVAECFPGSSDHFFAIVIAVVGRVQGRERRKWSSSRYRLMREGKIA